MSARIARVLATVSDDYLPESHRLDGEARQQRLAELAAEVERRAGELWDEENRRHLPSGLHGAAAVETARRAYTTAEDTVIKQEIIARIPPRAVHDRRHRALYRDSGSIETTDPMHVEIFGADATYWHGRAREAAVAVEPVGNPADYRGSDPIEDVALPPQVDLSDTDRRRALEEAIRIVGLEPGQWIELEWPLEASLYDPGNVYMTEFELCPVHAEAEDDTGWDECLDCQDSVEEAVEYPAIWRWTARACVYEICFDEQGDEYDQPVWDAGLIEVATREQDPREILIGPPGAGRFW